MGLALVATLLQAGCSDSACVAEGDPSDVNHPGTFAGYEVERQDAHAFCVAGTGDLVASTFEDQHALADRINDKLPGDIFVWVSPSSEFAECAGTPTVLYASAQHWPQVDEAFSRIGATLAEEGRGDRVLLDQVAPYCEQ